MPTVIRSYMKTAVAPKDGIRPNLTTHKDVQGRAAVTTKYK